MEMRNKVYLLKRHEFLLLAAAAGLRRLYGFDMEAGRLEQEEAIYELQKLTGKGYLKAEDGKFVLSGEMTELFAGIKHAETVLEVHKTSGRSCILYIGGTTVKVSESMRRKDTFELTQLPFNCVWNYLLEEGWITEVKEES